MSRPAAPELKILGACEIVTGIRSRETLAPRRVDLTKHPSLRPHDLALLALLATKETCSRLETIRFLNPSLEAVTLRLEQDGALSAQEHDALDVADKDVTYACSRIRTVFRQELGPSERSARRQGCTPTHGWIRLDGDQVTVDYRDVKQILTKTKTRAATGRRNPPNQR